MRYQTGIGYSLLRLGRQLVGPGTGDHRQPVAGIDFRLCIILPVRALGFLRGKPFSDHQRIFILRLEFPFTIQFQGRCRAPLPCWRAFVVASPFSTIANASVLRPNPLTCVSLMDSMVRLVSITRRPESGLTRTNADPTGGRSSSKRVRPLITWEGAMIRSDAGGWVPEDRLDATLQAHLRCLC